MKLLFLIPPSEGKKHWWNLEKELVTFPYKKPLKIAKHATPKDLKCDWKRYQEWITLNKNIEKWPFMEAIERYDGILYKAINYKNITSLWKTFFEEHFLIVSWMYWLVAPHDSIWNYKLPVETKWLQKFWSKYLTKELHNFQCDALISLLPESYVKVFNTKKLGKPFIQVNFLTLKDGKEIKMAHGSKKVKWEFIRNICEKQLSDFNLFWGKISQQHWITRIDFYENA